VIHFLSTSHVLLSLRFIVANAIGRFAAQDLTKIRKDVVPTANDSNKNAFSHQFLPKLRPSSQLMLSILACETWVLAQMVALVP